LGKAKAAGRLAVAAQKRVDEASKSVRRKKASSDPADKDLAEAMRTIDAAHGQQLNLENEKRRYTCLTIPRRPD
jgi:hypothetical protein